jgi:hypothetical protein
MNGLLRIEARRNALPPLLPLLALVLWLTPIGQHLQPVALWPDRSTDIQSSIQLTGPFTAAAAAWMASRERRRAMTDLLDSTALTRWRRWTATWAATCGWAWLFYAAVTGVFFAVTATQATWGHPVAWPVLSGLTALAAFSAAGFAAGRLVPSQVTTPLAGIGTFLLMAAGMALAVNGWKAGWLSPVYPSLGLSSSVFYAIRPDLAYLQITCYLGVTVAALSLIVLRGHAGDPAVRHRGMALAATGLALITAATALVFTGHSDAQGIVIPLLHNAASDRAAPYTPVCIHDRTIPVCLHPAYAAANELTAFDTTVSKIIAPLAGSPGLPVRAEQLPGGATGGYASVIAGNPLVLRLPHFIMHGNSIEPAPFAAVFRTQIALALVTPPGTAPGVNKSRGAGTSAPGTGPSPGPRPADTTTSAQQAVALYLLKQAGYSASTGLIPPQADITAAAQRLAALSHAARHAWLTTRIGALRAGTLTLTEIP